ncbi:MAG TPA: hypothetical protein VFV36_10525 [Candidatus Methylomirabilis sp.]|nr:hypothetical protein [Candidatus Methylomirabilis sp.]
MKRLIPLGLFATTIFFGGTAFADAAKGLKLQELFAWSAQAAKSAASVQAYQQYPGHSDTASTH